jgi:NitT/TauT family transport system ATP-binding protein
MTGLQVDIKRKEFSNAGICALQEMHFDTSPGEFLAIVGPSGAGKSTLLNIVAGLDQNVEGRVYLDGHSLFDSDQSRSRIGFMFQDARLMPWLTVLDNILLVLDADGKHIEKAQDLLHQVGLDEFAKVYPRQLSGGMQRRVALGPCVRRSTHAVVNGRAISFPGCPNRRATSHLVAQSLGIAETYHTLRDPQSA